MLSTHTGGNVYSNSEYDAYTGRIVSEYTVTRPLKNGYVLRKHVQVIDVGRPASVAAIDEDAQLGREPLPASAYQLRASTQRMIDAAAAVHDRVRIERHARLVAAIKEHGPISQHRAAALLGCNRRTIKDMLSLFEGVVEIGRTYPGGLWLGFAGQTPPKTGLVLSPVAQSIYNCLEKHGPLRTLAICERTGISYGNVKNCIACNRDVFYEHAVGYTEPFKKKYGIFGLVGIHDTEVQP